ncbi:hypothetical protein [Streptomyces sp. NPDC093149]
MLLVPHRIDGMSEEVPPADYQRIVRVITGAPERAAQDPGGV